MNDCRAFEELRVRAALDAGGSPAMALPEDIYVFGILNTGRYIGRDLDGFMYSGVRYEGTSKIEWEPMLDIAMKHWHIAGKPHEST